MKKTIYLLILLFMCLYFFQNIYAQGSWDRINSPTESNLRSVYFVDSLYGWAVGDSGTIIHTSSGGSDWNIQTSNTLNNIVDVFFLDRNTGWSLSWNFSVQPFGTIVLSTTNGGTDWTAEFYREENYAMNTILFFDSMNGWMVGNPHTIVKTTDGGANWEHAFVDTMPLAFFPVIGIAFYNDRYGYACGGQYDIAGVIWSTSDGGDKWYPIKSEDAPAEPVQAIHILDSLNVIGISGGFEPIYPIDIIRTTDGGVSWEYESLPFNGEPVDLDFRNDTEVWIPIATGGTFIVSTDAGINWEQITAPDTSLIFDVMFADSMHGFAVGNEGVILKYDPPRVDNTDNVEVLSNNKFQLEQNYPNPFNPVTTIRFSIPDIQYTTIKVYDVLGNVVSILVSEVIQAGNHSVDFSIDNFKLSSGIYFYQLKAGNFTQSKKMLLLK